MKGEYQRRGRPLNVAGWDPATVKKYMQWQFALLKAEKIKEADLGGFRLSLPDPVRKGEPSPLPQVVQDFLATGKLFLASIQHFQHQTLQVCSSQGRKYKENNSSLLGSKTAINQKSSRCSHEFPRSDFVPPLRQKSQYQPPDPQTGLTLEDMRKKIANKLLAEARWFDS